MKEAGLWAATFQRHVEGANLQMAIIDGAERLTDDKP
jgi:hypothetical protein